MDIKDIEILTNNVIGDICRFCRLVDIKILEQNTKKVRLQINLIENPAFDDGCLNIKDTFRVMVDGIVFKHFGVKPLWNNTNRIFYIRFLGE